MSTQGVFSAGVSGMGPALSAEGERVVSEKMEARDRLLDDLEKRGLRIDALAHVHRSDCQHGCDHDCAHGGDCAGNHADDQVVGPEETLEDAQARIRLQEGRIRHLEHLLAVRDNQVLLLREALESLRNKEDNAQGD